MGRTLRSQLVERDWWTKDERVLAKTVVRGIARLFKSRGVDQTPLVLLRVDDVLTSLLLVRRQETPIPSNENSQSTPEVNVAQLENAAKARERMRKAMKELEDCCAKAGTPITPGVAETFRPMLKRAVGIMDDALRYQAEHRSANAETDSD